MDLKLEKQLLEHFRKYYEMSLDDLFQVLQMSQTTAKNKLFLISKKILAQNVGVKEAFDSAGLELKTVKFESNGSLKQSMSFNQIDYAGIVNEDWATSYWRETVTRRFFFVIFKNDEFDITRLKKAMFWSMPELDLKAAKKFWEHTRSLVRNEDFDHFMSISDDMVCHVRSKATNKKDIFLTASGKEAPKKAYWINASYIKEVVG